MHFAIELTLIGICLALLWANFALSQRDKFNKMEILALERLIHQMLEGRSDSNPFEEMNNG